MPRSDPALFTGATGDSPARGAGAPTLQGGGRTLRRAKWIDEEVAFAERLMAEWNRVFGGERGGYRVSRTLRNADAAVYLRRALQASLQEDSQWGWSDDDVLASIAFYRDDPARRRLMDGRGAWLHFADFFGGGDTGRGLENVDHQLRRKGRKPRGAGSPVVGDGCPGLQAGGQTGATGTAGATGGSPASAAEQTAAESLVNESRHWLFELQGARRAGLKMVPYLARQLQHWQSIDSDDRRRFKAAPMVERRLAAAQAWAAADTATRESFLNLARQHLERLPTRAAPPRDIGAAGEILALALTLFDRERAKGGG